MIDRVLIGVSQVTVDLEDSQFDAMEPSEQLLLVAQIVLTLTGDPGYTAVAFESDGQPPTRPPPEQHRARTGRAGHARRLRVDARQPLTSGQ